MLSLDPVPVRWLAPECLQHKRFSGASDAWAFGVLCWEVYSDGSIPYGELAPGQIVAFLAQGQRLARPRFMPTQLYDLTLRAWAVDAIERPALAELPHALTALSWQLLDDSVGYTLPDQHREAFRPPFPWQHVTLASTKQFTGQASIKEKEEAERRGKKKNKNEDEE